jgi:calcium/calmodulin-dependent protein kinase I
MGSQRNMHGGPPPPGADQPPEDIMKRVKNEPISGAYNIGRQLGKGAFAIVKEATNKQTGEKAAIKIIPQDKVAGEDLRLLRREIANLLAIEHPNILKLLEVYEDPQNFYLVMELIQGKELFDKIIDMGNYSERDAAHIMSQILDALAYLHSKGICHRDLKPENLMSVGSGQRELIKIADFGLSKNFEEDTMRTSCGSPLYVAPEILTAEQYDAQVDMWSMGVILYILLVGYPPFNAANPGILYRQIIEGQWTFGDGWEGISAEAKDLVRKLMTRDPRKRLSAAQALQHPWIARRDATNASRLETSKLKQYMTTMRNLNA